MHFSSDRWLGDSRIFASHLSKVGRVNLCHPEAHSGCSVCEAKQLGAPPAPSGGGRLVESGIYLRLRYRIGMSGLYLCFRNNVCDTNDFLLNLHWVAMPLKLKTVPGGPGNCYVIVTYVVPHGQLLLVTDSDRLVQLLEETSSQIGTITEPLMIC